mgnify:CR=1 FL=1
MLGIEEKVSLMACLSSENNLRPETRAVINYLQKNLKKEIYILSGDASDTVNSLGDYLGIPRENLVGDTSAESKMQFLRKMRANKKEVFI